MSEVIKNQNRELNITQEKSKSKRMKKLIIAVILSAIVLVCFGLGFLTSYLISENSKTKLEQVIDTIQKEGIFLDKTYYGGNLSEDQMLATAVKGILAQDNYAKYYSASEYQTYLNQSNGSYSGIGVTFISSSTNSSLSTTVLSVVGNSPAEKAGIRANDKIVAGKTYGQDFVNFANGSDFESFINGVALNKEFTLKIQKSPSGQQKEVSLYKSNYKASYIKYYDNTTTLNFISKGSSGYEVYQTNTLTQLGDDTAMIKVERFYGDMVTQFKSATDYMKQNSKTKLILDLRGNGGGSVNVMLALSQYLIYNNGKNFAPILYAIDKDNDSTLYSNAMNLYLEWIEKTVVLADANTASASECLINAMLYYGNIDGNFSKDNLIIADLGDGNAKTFGKGIMQKYFTFSDGSALKLTTALLYAPDKTTCIHGKGITTTQENSVLRSEVFNRALALMAN